MFCKDPSKPFADMPRSRKPRDAATIPLISPSTIKTISGNPQKPLFEISEEEQWRLINQSGILQSSSLQPEPTMAQNTEELATLSDEIFNAALLIIPFSSLLLLMEILIRHQYGKDVTLDIVLDRMLPGVPILSIFIFYTTRYKHRTMMQIGLLIISIFVGSRMLYLLDNASWLVNMQQCPPLATIWIYTMVQLELGRAVLSLLAVGAFVWYNGIKILSR